MSEKKAHRMREIKKQETAASEEKSARLEAMQKEIRDAITLVNETVPPSRVPGNQSSLDSRHELVAAAENWWCRRGGSTEMADERRPYKAQVIELLGRDISLEKLLIACSMIYADAGAVSEGLKLAQVDLNRLQSELEAFYASNKLHDYSMVVRIALTASLKGVDEAMKLARINYSND